MNLNENQIFLLKELNQAVTDIDVDKFAGLVVELNNSIKDNGISQIEEVQKQIIQLKIKMEAEIQTMSDVLLEKKKMNNANQKYNLYR